MKLNKLRYKGRDHVGLDAEALAKQGTHSTEQGVMLSASLAMAGQVGSFQHSRGRSCCRRDHACAPRATTRAHHVAPGKTRSPWPVTRRLPHRVIGIQIDDRLRRPKDFPNGMHRKSRIADGRSETCVLRLLNNQREPHRTIEANRCRDIDCGQRDLI